MSPPSGGQPIRQGEQVSGHRAKGLEIEQPVGLLARRIRRHATGRNPLLVDIQPRTMSEDHPDGPLLCRWLAGSLNVQSLRCVLHCPNAAGDNPWCLEGSGLHFGSGARHQLKPDLTVSRAGGILSPGTRLSKPTTLFMARGAVGDMITLATQALAISAVNGKPWVKRSTVSRGNYTHSGSFLSLFWPFLRQRLWAIERLDISTVGDPVFRLVKRDRQPRVHVDRLRAATKRHAIRRTRGGVMEGCVGV